MSEKVIKNLEYARMELLDMGLRGNTLLNLRQSAKTIEVVDEIPREIYKILVENQKAMSFLPVPEEVAEDDSEDSNSDVPLPQLLEEMYGGARHTDTRLQTRLNNDQLDRKLLKISNEAQTYYEEQGVDILYLALGFLTWYEDANSTTVRKAPLILIPVELKRSSASDRYKLVYTEADIGPNLTLAAKLKSEFRVTLPDFPEEMDVDQYFDSVSEHIAALPRWKVNTCDISLGFFSFGRFQMYQDLDSANWPEDKKPSQHKIMKALLGDGLGDFDFTGLAQSAGEGEGGPNLVELSFVKDADSSQTEAVMAVKSGSNLVIQGPPGTGKSQTITNIISESLADGKRILFVAEKMAALEVVKRRLDECHLGDAVLELHSHKSNKKAVMEELKRTLDLGVPQVPCRALEKAKYEKARENLDDYCGAVNEKILNSGVSYIDALGHHLKIQKIATTNMLPALDFSSLRDWNANQYADACDLVGRVIEHLAEMGTPSKNPFSSTRLTDFSPIQQNELTSMLMNAHLLVERCKSRSQQISHEMNLQTGNTLDAIQTLHRAATRAVQAPHVAGLSLTTDDWQQRRDRIHDLLKAGSRMSQLREKRGDQLIEQGWSADLLSARSAWATTGPKWWRFLSGDFRTAKKTLQGLMKSELPKDAAECLGIIDDVLEQQTCLESYRKHEQLGASIFGAQWQEEASDWSVLSSLSKWVIELYDEVGRGEIPPAILHFLEGNPELSDWTPRLEGLSRDAENLEKLILDIVDRLRVDLPGATEIAASDVDLETLVDTMKLWNDHIDDLYKMTRYNRLLSEFDSPGLKQIADLSFSWEKDPQLLLTTLQASWYAGLVEEAYSKRESLRHFDRIGQEKLIQDFKTLDKDLFSHAQEELVSKLHDRLPNIAAAGEMAIIRKEMNKKRRHLAIRKLIRQAGRAIQQIKPVFMMSPMSVATYLEQGAVEFDLVVFDEASQVKVVDAMGSILRGNQVVVVGDTKQMPPTDFFSKAIELDDEEAEESQTADIESILGMFLSQGAPEVMLKWHYRSRHDSLIAVSNQEFYDGKLMIFPSPGVNPQAKGLMCNLLPDTVYERGGSRTNPGEARAVAEAVMRHVIEHSDLTLGVVAFSTAQRDRILLEVERLRRERPECEEFFNTVRTDGESFFVKNLENVQGDERDIILISLAYGRTHTGNVSQSFGPVNREGGERRLNVLITRARLGMEVFTNFTSDDLKTKAATPFGVRALKNFLKYAETGELERPEETGKDTDSPFEDEVLSAVRGMGYEVEPQVGSAGFFIDIAVRDPNKPGRYALAVECDGASYHSSANARDRDRLRQEVLEGLGWRFHRIWSTDWFRSPQKEGERLKESIENAIAALQNQGIASLGVQAQTGSSSSVVADINRDSASFEEINNRLAYSQFAGNLGLPNGVELHELRDSDIHDAVSRILNTEGPIHIDQLGKRMAESVGVGRVGGRIAERILTGVKTGANAGKFYFKDSFLYFDSNREVEIRDRSALTGGVKNIEYVPPEEMSAALYQTVEHAFSLPRQEAISEALAMMGFQRSTQKASSAMNAMIDQLVQSGKLIDQDGTLSLIRTE